MQRKRAPNWLTALVIVFLTLALLSVTEYAADRTPTAVAALLFLIGLWAAWREVW